jgi:hypothetical protein
VYIFEECIIWWFNVTNVSIFWQTSATDEPADEDQTFEFELDLTTSSVPALSTSATPADGSSNQNDSSKNSTLPSEEREVSSKNEGDDGDQQLPDNFVDLSQIDLRTSPRKSNQGRGVEKPPAVDVQQQQSPAVEVDFTSGQIDPSLDEKQREEPGTTTTTTKRNEELDLDVVSVMYRL